MGLQKQARVLSKAQGDALLAYVGTRRYPERNRVIVLLSTRAGLRAKEIARLTWDMVLGADDQVGTSINLHDRASKGRHGGRVIPLNKELRKALVELAATRGPEDDRDHSPYVVTTERSRSTSPGAVVNLFAHWYRSLGFRGCSSHSGRRTFITNAARKISTVGGSLRDVQALAGHTSLGTTQKYIDLEPDAARKVVDLV
jgi:integrase/recombinase XerD